jgi:3-hydroxybutyryl-CoA dehydrogenase
MNNNFGVIGAGQMGSGIAHIAAIAGYTVTLVDISEEALQKGIANISKNMDRQVSKGALSEEDKKNALGRIRTTTGYESFIECDFVIEAATENENVKNEIFKKLVPNLNKDAIIATNTSSISITRLAAKTDRPHKFMGMHFMNPVPVMKLVELIRGLQTSDKTYAAIQDFCSKIDKTTVLAIDTPGFIVNRILCPMINEAIFLVQEGVKPEDIDTAMKLGTNQPMGPLTLADFVGLDTLLYILQLLHRELGEDKYRPCPLLVKYVEAGWFGKKSGRGFYSY